ncbi:MAG: CehA/McbA family metallohydrolase [Fidelibacterota bacterium]
MHILGLLPVIFLYAEIHYRFKWFISLLKKDEPEITADAPHRVEPGSKIPVLCLIKDADRYPIFLKKIEVKIRKSGNIVYLIKKIFQSPIDTGLWTHLFEIPVEKGLKGYIEIDVNFFIIKGKRKKRVINNNYRTATNKSLVTYISENPLPCDKNWYFGDLHYHTSYTSDQVEFGAPLIPSATTAKSLGLKFFAATDHSYDLDDHPDIPNYNDSDLRKWRMLNREISRLNSENKDSFTILKGEELSCSNSNLKNVHLILLNNSNFYPGSGDSAENWFNTNCEYRIAEILNRIEKGVLTFAAHPLVSPPILQVIFIKRGIWKLRDIMHGNLTGLQILNGDPDPGFQRGKKLWINLLLRGSKKIIVAGNDAHGNFNVFRQLFIPFITLREHKRQLFGKSRTGIYVDGKLCEKSLVSAISKRRVIISNGPFVSFEVETEEGEIYRIGDTGYPGIGKVNLKSLSSPEFGRLHSLKLIKGIIKDGKEMEEIKIERFQDSHIFEMEKELQMKSRTYYRAEVETRKDGKSLICLTNPLWVE